VDHCHDCGYLRGTLCRPCNRLLTGGVVSILRETERSLLAEGWPRKAQRFLAKHRCGEGIRYKDYVRIMRWVG